MRKLGRNSTIASSSASFNCVLEKIELCALLMHFETPCAEFGGSMTFDPPTSAPEKYLHAKRNVKFIYKWNRY